jgi:hypothetical protein
MTPSPRSADQVATCDGPSMLATMWGRADRPAMAAKNRDSWRVDVV